MAVGNATSNTTVTNYGTRGTTTTTAPAGVTTTQQQTPGAPAGGTQLWDLDVSSYKNLQKGLVNIGGGGNVYEYEDMPKDVAKKHFGELAESSVDEKGSVKFEESDVQPTTEKGRKLKAALEGMSDEDRSKYFGNMLDDQMKVYDPAALAQRLKEMLAMLAPDLADKSKRRPVNFDAYGSISKDPLTKAEKQQAEAAKKEKEGNGAAGVSGVEQADEATALRADVEKGKRSNFKG